MKTNFNFRKTWLVLALLIVAPLTRGETESKPTGDLPEQPERWSSFLPLMGEEATKRGYELPLPFGVSGVYNYIQRDITVNDLRLGLNGAPPRSVSRFVNLGSTSKVNAAVGRFDVWVLPFVNVYGLLGYIHNQSTTQGFVGGAGLTLAGGYKSFFVMADANYSQTDMGFDDTFRALIVSFRTGWNGKIGSVPTRLWVGAMYWDTENVAESTVLVAGEGTVNFEADQGPTHPWNASIGGSVAVSKQWEMFLEYGFNLDDVQVIATGLTCRF